MATSNNLMDAVVRFTGTDVDAFRREWNAQIDGSAETPEKQAVFEQAQKNIQSKNLIAGGISAKVLMKYTSLSGEVKNRSVIIRRIFKSGKEMFIDAFCLDINAPRIIKMQNILQIVDEKTKTLYAQPLAFFADVLGVDIGEKSEQNTIRQPKPAVCAAPTYAFNSTLKDGELKTAIDRTRHEITALLFVSAMDGDRDPRELQKVVEYVHKRCPDLTFDDAHLMRYLQMNYPDAQSFYFALERILGKEGWVVKMFLEKLLELIVADGRTDEKEKLFLADFLRILQEEGFDLNFKTG